ncbi:hypothetical protein BG61_29360 [Caballeronia glathei]|uniref:Uncharacterized protein n=1 Tax=Caballeronia glathei TaxID=60547 RepID=A0A069PT15_9BURK|nr:hypothetical protein BG61_29360 [Caballeronia glathei]
MEPIATERFPFAVTVRPTAIESVPSAVTELLTLTVGPAAIRASGGRLLVARVTLRSARVCAALSAVEVGTAEVEASTRGCVIDVLAAGCATSVFSACPICAPYTLLVSLDSRAAISSPAASGAAPADCCIPSAANAASTAVPAALRRRLPRAGEPGSAVSMATAVF